MNVGKLSFDNLERFGDYTSLHFMGKPWSNVECHAYAGRMARVLQEHGVREGDRVLVMMPNSPQVIAAFQAAWRIGAVIIPVTPQWGPREVNYLLENSEAKVAITHPVLLESVHEATKGVGSFKELLYIGESQHEIGTDITAEIEAATPIEELASRADDDLALLLYTSGTTGLPKGVMLTHQNLLSNAESVAKLRYYEPQTPTVHVLPLSHSYGVLIMNLGYIFAFTAALLPRFVPQEVFETIERYKVSIFSVVPTMMTYMLSFPDRDKYDTSSLVRVSSGGAALLNEVRLEFEKVFNCEVRDGYGLSECAPTACSYYEGDDYRPGSVGRAIPGVKVEIHDNDGKALATGETGEICIQGPNVMTGYWKNDEATQQALEGGWLHSGDVGTMDEDGFVYITDRKKDLIIKGGENISPREIEEALHDHPAVAEAAAVGIPDAKFGEDIWAAVKLKPGASVTEQELQAHAAEFVTKFKVPTHIVFWEDLPKNPVGKILKRSIREELTKAQRS